MITRTGGLTVYIAADPSEELRVGVNRCVAVVGVNALK